MANVSHDFRSPLTNIRGYIGAILDGTIPPEIQEKYLKIILRETDRLTKLTEQLLEMNRYENNGIILNYSTFDINEVIRNAASSFEKHCTEKKISIHLIFNTPSLYVDADRDKISQVIQNLIDNAVKFSSPDSSIEIQTTVQKDKIFVTVSDHGIGIPEEIVSIKRMSPAERTKQAPVWDLPSPKKLSMPTVNIFTPPVFWEAVLIFLSRCDIIHQEYKFSISSQNIEYTKKPDQKPLPQIRFSFIC